MNPAFQKGLKILVSGLMLLSSHFLAATPREDFLTTFLLFSGIFLGMISINYWSKNSFSWKYVFLLGLGMRISVGMLVPNWSEDYARFLWDGKLVELGENPYSETPRKWVENPASPISDYQLGLFEDMNSPDYYSVYPPLNQAAFWVVSGVFGDSQTLGILGLRILLLLGELGVFFLLIRLLNHWNITSTPVIWYWLNPLVVMETIGNVHFEGLVLLFLLASVFALSHSKFGLSGGFWAMAAGLKLLPLILFPAFFFFQQLKKKLSFWIVFGVIFGWSMGILFMGESYLRFLESLRLYSGKFEFNASIYYLFREVGFWIQGYNVIGDLTKILSVLTLVLVFYLCWKRRTIQISRHVDLMVMVYLIYLILQPVVHPWYLLPGLGLSVLAGRKTFLLWSFGAIFSYQAYGNPDNWENPLFLLLEYGLVFLGIWWDYFQPKRNSNFETLNHEKGTFINSLQ